MRFAFVLVLGFLGCTDVENHTIEIGELYYNIDGTPIIELPSQGTLGRALEISVTTVGGQCVTADSTTIDIADDEVHVTPYDKILQTDRKCQLMAIPQKHEASVVFDTIGIKTVIVHGRRPIRSGFELVDVEFSIEIIAAVE